jgi:DNA modification methylase
MGVGTTALACINLNVKFLGTEIDNKYIEIANENIKLRYIKKYKSLVY